MKNNNTNNVYIMSIEGADLYSHMVRDRKIKKEYGGMLAYSLELIKLREEGLKVKINKKYAVERIKEQSDDIINVKFKYKVQSAEDVIKVKNKALDKMEKKLVLLEVDKDKDKNSLEKYNKLNAAIKGVKESITAIQKEVKDDIKPIRHLKLIKSNTKYNIVKFKFKKWSEVSNEALRKHIYENGFTINTVSSEIDEKHDRVISRIRKEKYVVYKRSGSKSRTGQCLFCKVHLYENMINWCRMNLIFDEENKYKLSFASLLAYESLVGSALEGLVKINPKNILILDDVDSIFPWKCNVVSSKKSIKCDENGEVLLDEEGNNVIENGFLQSVEHKEWMVKNSIFDGESLLESSYYQEGQSMNLLRNHMFKSASFSCHIQKYLKAHCPKGQNYDTWKLTNRFGQTILAKDVHMICTSTSLKAFKFSKILGTDLDMWEYWKKIVIAEGCIFGVCKHEKPSKRGYDDNGNLLQQSSYQFCNSIQMEYSDMEELTKFEKEYIMKLKNDDDFFIKYLIETNNDVNSNMMFASLAIKNKDFVNVELFRDFRKVAINKYVKHVRHGKIRLAGDYAIVLGNGMELLLHATGKLVDENNKILKSVEDNLLLKENEFYTKLHADGLELVSFRNPHTSPSNLFIGRNKYIKDYDTYFCLSKNIVCANAINYPNQDIFSSLDYDSDSIAIFNNNKLKELCKKIQGQYNVCINDVKSDSKVYKINKSSMSTIDNVLATSSKNIGNVVNTGQICLATYWDMLTEEKYNKEIVDGLLKATDICTVLSCISIDLAKKFYSIDIDKEIENIEKTKGLREKKPTFFKYVSQSKTIKNRVEDYNCPMDYLGRVMDNLKNADDHDDIEFWKLIINKNEKIADRKQRAKVIKYVDEMNDKIKGINATHIGDDDDVIEEKNILTDNVIQYYTFYMNKLTVDENTMYSLLNKVIKNNSHIATRLLNVLYETQTETFLNAFKEKISQKS